MRNGTHLLGLGPFLVRTGLGRQNGALICAHRPKQEILAPEISAVGLVYKMSSRASISSMALVWSAGVLVRRTLLAWIVGCMWAQEWPQDAGLCQPLLKSVGPRWKEATHVVTHVVTSLRFSGETWYSSLFAHQKHELRAHP